MLNGLSPILLIGIAGLAFVFVQFARNWREWLRMPETPPTHIAGEDDQELDFTAALFERGPLPPLREFPEWPGCRR